LTCPVKARQRRTAAGSYVAVVLSRIAGECAAARTVALSREPGAAEPPRGRLFFWRQWVPGGKALDHLHGVAHGGQVQRKEAAGIVVVLGPRCRRFDSPRAAVGRELDVRVARRLACRCDVQWEKPVVVGLLQGLRILFGKETAAPCP
jgi:hypothetical protein